MVVGLPSKSRAMPHQAVDAINRFGFQLQPLTLEPDKSNGLCPLNIYQCLMMVAAGAKGETIAAFATALGFSAEDLDGAVESTVHLTDYSKTNSAVILSNAASAWFRPAFKVDPQWQDTVQTVFSAAVGQLNLSAMNTFIEKETHGKFKNLLKPDALTGAQFMLITCLYFKALWAEPFDSDISLKNEKFYAFDSDKPAQSCTLMHKVAKMEYREDRRMQLCILPYKGSNSGETLGKSSGGGGTGGTPPPRWKAAVILPKQRGVDTMRDLLDHISTSPHPVIESLILCTADHPETSSPPATTKVNLWLPRFKQRLHLDLIPPLSTLGLSPAFDSATADFTGISAVELSVIDSVTHDLFVEVNEEGTEVAAVTTITGRKRAMKPEVIVDMRVDRPFLFVVYDGTTGLVLCSVVVVEVEEET